MKISALLLTTALTVSVAMPAALAADDAPKAPITTQTATEIAPAVDASSAAQDLRLAGISFIQHVNYARVALAMNNVQLGKQHIVDAQKLLGTIHGANPDTLRMTGVAAGNVKYKENTGKFYYPLDAGAIEVEKTNQGPFWGRDGLAVTDAEIAYVTLDFRNDDADKYLAKALQEVDGGKIKAAQNDLGWLMHKVVDTHGKETSLPLDRARDNIALARSFIAMQNYDGARYALKHADKALNAMDKDDRYKDRRTAIDSMRQDVALMQTTVQKNDPSAWQKADAKMKEWWGSLKSWAND